jgi:hypothetical protein
MHGNTIKINDNRVQQAAQKTAVNSTKRNVPVSAYLSTFSAT